MMKLGMASATNQVRQPKPCTIIPPPAEPTKAPTGPPSHTNVVATVRFSGG